jgi:hypothetical protein
MSVSRRGKLEKSTLKKSAAPRSRNGFQPTKLEDTYQTIHIIGKQIQNKMSNDKKQTAVKLIFENFNLLSDADFKTWMLNSYNVLEEMEEQQAFEFWQGGIKCTDEGGKSFDQYYNQTYGGGE